MKHFKYLFFILIFLSSCSKNIKDIEIDENIDTVDIKDSIENEEPFVCNNSDYESFQNYIPIPWKNSVWESVHWDYTNGSKHITRLITNGDTLIKGLCYFELLKEKFIIYQNNDTTYSREVIAWVRQEIDQKKVYFIHAYWPETERLQYDFNLGLGDTLNPDMYKLHGEIHTVHDIDSILINNRYHSIYQIRVGSFLNVFYLIEGIGNSKGWFASYLEGGNLTAFYYNDQLVYP